MIENGASRTDVTAFALEKYGTKEENLWAKFPDCAVLRHPVGKWYGVVMNVSANKLGLPSDIYVDILVAKCGASLRDVFLDGSGCLPAYHMNRDNWITVLLDGSVDKELVFHIIEQSYLNAGNGRRK